MKTSLTILCLSAFFATACGKNSSNSAPSVDVGQGGGGGSSTLEISGDFTTNCFQTAGTVVAGGNYYKTIARYAYNGAGTFNYSKYYYADSACNGSIIYGSSQTGTYAVGSALTGSKYLVAYTIASSYIVVFGASASATLNAGCTSNVSWTSSGSNSLGTVTGNFACAGLDVSVAKTHYNSASLSGVTLTTGVPDGDDPGVNTVNAVDMNGSVSFNKF